MFSSQAVKLLICHLLLVTNQVTINPKVDYLTNARYPSSEPRCMRFIDSSKHMQVLIHGVAQTHADVQITSLDDEIVKIMREVKLLTTVASAGKEQERYFYCSCSLIFQGVITANASGCF